jgi:hypothetical protein
MEIKLYPPRTYEDLTYVLWEDIINQHGKRIANKISEELRGSTCGSVPEFYKNGKIKKYNMAIYYWDYERFAKKVINNTPTYFD